MMLEYIDYRTLKEFYTIQETCELLGLEKDALREKCQECRIMPVRNELGEGGFVKYDFRKLHYALYCEDRRNQQEWDPWA
ncbi:MAG: hypothetical protein HDT15_12030 [Oscillibacter sp.]|nr:hypothetical protein [Oscillibacter sp.]